MDLPDCPPGAEGYEDSVIEMPKKPELVDTCTKAEAEFQEHLNSLKIKVEDGSTRCMVERRGRDVSGKWIYLCYPCAAMCSGESILQTHISGKKHKSKLALRNVWPMTIFTEHPHKQSEKGTDKTDATNKILQKMAEEVEFHNTNTSDLDQKYNKYRNIRCHIQDILDTIKAPLLGVEYLIEHPPEQSHYEPSYICTLCSKQGHPRTIVNHMTCFWHRYNYLVRHFATACNLLTPYRSQQKYREGVTIIMNRMAQRIEDKYGRMKPVNIDKEEYEKNREVIHSWIFKSHHFAETKDCTFKEVVDVDLIDSLHKSYVKTDDKYQVARKNDKKDPSPPVVAAPSKPHFNNFTRSSGRQERRGVSIDSLSDVSDEDPVGAPRRRDPPRDERHSSFRDRHESKYRFEPYPDRRREGPPDNRYGARNVADKGKIQDKLPKPANYEYKVKLAAEKRLAAEESAKKTLAYHEKNPEKHPLYPEEWKKFWNRRYKEIQAEGKDPSKHDFKPEWIVFWTARMKELHDEELRVIVNEVYRKLCLTPPDMTRRSPEAKPKSESRHRSPRPDRAAEQRRRSPDLRRRSPAPRKRSPDLRRRSPDLRRRSPDVRRRSPDIRRDRKSPDFRRSPARRRSPERRRSPPRQLRTRSRSPVHGFRSPARTHITLESVRRSRSPLSLRDAAQRNSSPQRNRSPLRNRSPRRNRSPLRNLSAQRNRSPQLPAVETAPSMQTVLVSDDELKPDDGISPWNSDNSLDSIGSLPEVRSLPRERSHTGSVMSHGSRSRRDFPRMEPTDLGPAENVVATLRLLVALEDYLGSLGPKIVDLLTEALKMEKEKGNSSEELLERESAVVLIETAKEKLKGAAQAGLVPASAAPAVRGAVVRAAATLHVADTRLKKKQQQQTSNTSKSAPVPVAGVGEVDRAQIAQQMAAALIAQGKTDVSSEELAQLVDAVVGMAQAKKLEAMAKKKVEMRAAADKASRPAPAAVAGTASALQMLQSAYVEIEKKPEKEEVPDAMDGLSDSDLETLLKNFNELSAEEQHSLIAYLKKLEAREPQRVERLRQYVSAAAAATPAAEDEATARALDEVKMVTIDSDDDDYTVEEVFKSVTEKVKEDQIRQEMEIVKKSLEESKVATPEPEITKPAATFDITKNISSATDLLALVQASIQSAPAATITQSADVVTSNMQPRSFGDLPERSSGPLEAQGSKFLTSNNAPINPIQNVAPSDNMRPYMQNMPINQSSFGNQQGGPPRPPQNQMNFGGNRNVPNEPYNQVVWEPPVQDNRGSSMQDNRGPPMQDNRGFLMQDNRGPPMQNNRGPIQDNRGPSMQDNRGIPMQDNRGASMQDNRGIPMQDNRGPSMQDNRGHLMQDNRGPMQDNRGPMQDNRGPMQDNRGPMQDNRGPMQDNRGPPGPLMRGQGFGQDGSHNQGARGNFNGRMQNMRQPDNSNQQFGYEQNNMRPPGNMNQQNNYGRRGGRGHFGGSMRGRGRGYY